MLTLVLAESELELIPPELVSHPAVISSAEQREKNPAKILLDSNYHHRAMSNLPEGRRRGRPDIVHLFLLTALESVVNKKGQLNVIIHTRHNDVISISPETRIMRNYERFVGLIEQLYDHHVVPDDKNPLLRIHRNITLQQVVENATADHVIAYSKTGTAVSLPSYFKELKRQNPHHLLCIIGGFPTGTFQTDLTRITRNVHCIYREMLTAWTVAGEILVNYEIAAL